MKVKIAISILIFIMLSNFFLSSNVLANSSSYYDKDAATVYPIENRNIVMQKEVVRIIPGPNVEWVADCEFTFFNKGETKEIVTMGYPDWINSQYNPGPLEAFWKYFDTWPADKRNHYKEDILVTGYGYDNIYLEGYKRGMIPYIPGAWNLHDLEVSVDSQNVEKKHKAIINGESLPGQGAYIWKVSFEPNQTKKVNVKFSFRGFTEL